MSFIRSKLYHLRFMDDFSGIRIPPFQSDPLFRSKKSCSHAFCIDKFMSKCHSKAKFLMHKAQYTPNSLLKRKKLERNKSFHDKLRDIFIESKRNAHEGFMDCNLLQRLVQRAHLNYMIINLFDIKIGFSLCIKTPSREQYVCTRPYEDTSILDYIDNEEVPYDILDVLEAYPHNFFYNGCCIAQVRDFKGTKGTKVRPVKSCFVLLKNLSTVNRSLFRGIRSKREERAAEAQLLFEDSDPLCLEPDATVSVIANNRAYYKHPFTCPPLRNLVAKHWKINIKCLVEDNIEQESNKLLSYIESFPLRPFEPVLSAIKFYKFRQKKPIISLLTLHPSIAPTLKTRDIRSAKDYEPNAVLKHVKVEEFIFEYEDKAADGSVTFSKDALYISQTPFDSLYHGTLVCKGKRIRKAYFFPLGRRKYLDRFITQLTNTLSHSHTTYLKVTRKEPSDLEKFFYMYKGEEFPDEDIPIPKNVYERRDKSLSQSTSSKSDLSGSAFSQGSTISDSTPAKDTSCIQLDFPSENGDRTYITDNDDFVPTTTAEGSSPPRLTPTIFEDFEGLQFSDTDDTTTTESSSDSKTESPFQIKPFMKGITIKLTPVKESQSSAKETHLKGLPVKKLQK